MKKLNATLLIWVGVIFGLATLGMMFLPQLSLNLEFLSRLITVSGDVSFKTAFFGGEVLFSENVRMVYHGSTLPFAGYILAGAGALVAALMALSKSKGARVLFGLFAFVLFVLASIFIWNLLPSFKTANNLATDVKIVGKIYKSINLTAPSIIAGVLSILSAVLVFLGMASSPSNSK